MSRTSRTTVAAVAAALAAAPVAAAEDHGHERAQPRVVVADGTAGTIRVYDARRGGAALRTLRVHGPAALATTDDGRYVIATQTAQDRVQAVDAGAWSEPHGDHVHHHARRPGLLPFDLSLPDPVHVVPHGDEVAIFADGTGEGRVFRTRDLRRRSPAAVTTLSTGKGHHGVAVPAGERAVVSKGDPAAEPGALPPTLDVVDRAGAVLSSVACPQAHGEVAHGPWAAFGCEDGIALVTPGAGGAPPASETLPYPAGATPERRAFALATDAAGRRVVGDFGSHELVVVDLATRRTRTIDVGRRVASFGVDAASGAILALTADGMLRRFDAATGRRTAVRRVVGRAFTPSWDAPSPKLAVRGGLAAVSDHRRDRVTVVRTAGLRHVRTLRVPGAPTNVAIAGTAAP